MGSARVLQSDSVDPYLSRYKVPHDDQAVQDSLVQIKWSGFLASQWVADLWIKTL